MLHVDELFFQKCMEYSAEDIVIYTHLPVTGRKRECPSYEV